MCGSIIWNPTQKGKIEEVEKVQHLFLRFLSYKTNAPMKYNEHNYDSIMKSTNINSLEYSRAINELKFLYKLLNNLVICPELESNIRLFKPVNPKRNPTLIFVVDSKLVSFSNLQRICYLANLNKDWIYFYDLSLYQFNKLINRNDIILSLPTQKI